MNRVYFDAMIKSLETLDSKEDFVAFLGLLIKDLKFNQDRWENKGLDSFLEATASWIEDMDGYYQNRQLPIPANVSWKVFAEILIAASIYE